MDTTNIPITENKFANLKPETPVYCVYVYDDLNHDVTYERMPFVASCDGYVIVGSGWDDDFEDNFAEQLQARCTESQACFDPSLEMFPEKQVFLSAGEAGKMIAETRDAWEAEKRKNEHKEPKTQTTYSDITSHREKENKVFCAALTGLITGLIIGTTIRYVLGGDTLFTIMM